MKIFSNTILMLSICIYGHGQYAYSDARKIVGIKKYLFDANINKVILKPDTLSLAEINSILKNYIPASELEKAKNDFELNREIARAFLNNPFLTVSAQVQDENLQKLKESLKAVSTKSVISSLGSLNVTSIADGLAQFLIKRGKEELNIAFFQRMKDFLDSNLEAETLFPATSDFLKKIESHRYAEFLQSLREAFYTDINNLIVNLNLLIDQPKYQNLLSALPEIRVAVRCAKIVSELSQGDDMAVHPADLIHQFAEIKEWGEMNVNLKGSWYLLDRISESVRKVNTISVINVDTVKISSDSIEITTITQVNSNIVRIDKSKMIATNLFRFDSVTKEMADTLNKPDEAWIKYKDFHDNILRDNVTLRIYLGLLYQRMEGIAFRSKFGSEITVQQFMRNNSNDILKIADFIENFLVLANDVDKSVKDIKQKQGQFTNDDYYTYVEKAINITEYGFKVANFIKPEIVNDRYIVMAKNANELYKNIYTKNYNAAVMNAYTILSEVLVKADLALNEKADFFDSLSVLSSKTPFDSVLLKDTIVFKASVAALNAAKFNEDKSIDNRNETVERILRYGNLIASIVKAESSQEAEAAIEAAVLPAGSSSIKKNSTLNVSLNAYIGGYFGKSTNTTDEIDGNNSTVGVTAPVGIALSWGLGYYKNNKAKGNSRGALSIYGTVIDVGAIAGYRLNDDSTALDQKITLNDIFAPGGYLVYGFGLPFKWASYVPLSVGYGWQYGSKLYYKNDDGKLDISDKSRWRSNWFIAIDIPLANFWTKNSTKKRK